MRRVLVLRYAAALLRWTRVGAASARVPPSRGSSALRRRSRRRATRVSRCANTSHTRSGLRTLLRSTAPSRREQFEPTAPTQCCSRQLRAAGELLLLAGGLGQRLLERAVATRLAGDRQLRGPRRDSAGESSRTFAARDLDRRALAELGEQARPVVLRGLIAPDLRPIEFEEVHGHTRALPW